MSTAETALFQLLRMTLGNNLLCPLPENVDWQKLVDLSFEQGVAAFAVDGLQMIFDQYPDYGLEIDKPELEDLKYEWFGSCIDTESKNLHQRKVLNAMADIWAAKGISTMLMKGQSNSLYYSEPLHRATGDIDVFLSDYEEGNKVAAEVGANVDTGWYKHSQIHWKGEMFENHQYFAHTRDGKRGKRLDGILRKLLEGVEYECFPDSKVLLPPVMFNALFLTYHSLAHFLSEGIRLKQILDWAVFLQKEQEKIDWHKFYALCEEFHFRRWVDVMNDIAVHLLGVDISVSGVVFDSPYTEKVLYSILRDKDFVFSSGKGGWVNRLHIVTNMFKYSWKYHQIYQDSIIRQLWFYASGFLFKTEK